MRVRQNESELGKEGRRSLIKIKLCGQYVNNVLIHNTHWWLKTSFNHSFVLNVE